MKPTHALATALVLAATTGGCAWWDAHGWKHSNGEPTTDQAKLQCETATATLKGKPDYDTALRACLDEKARRGK
jgi:hypothetical protein